MKKALRFPFGEAETQGTTDGVASVRIARLSAKNQQRRLEGSDSKALSYHNANSPLCRRRQHHVPANSPAIHPRPALTRMLFRAFWIGRNAEGATNKHNRGASS